MRFKLKKNYEIIFCGTPEEPCKVKSLNQNKSMEFVKGIERFDAEKKFVENFQK